MGSAAGAQLERRLRRDSSRGRQAARPARGIDMTSPLVGRPAVPFELPDADGRMHGLDEYRGRWLLLVMHRHLF